MGFTYDFYANRWRMCSISYYFRNSSASINNVTKVNYDIDLNIFVKNVTNAVINNYKWGISILLFVFVCLFVSFFFLGPIWLSFLGQFQKWIWLGADLTVADLTVTDLTVKLHNREFPVHRNEVKVKKKDAIGELSTIDNKVNTPVLKGYYYFLLVHSTG